MQPQCCDIRPIGLHQITKALCSLSSSACIVSFDELNCSQRIPADPDLALRIMISCSKFCICSESGATFMGMGLGTTDCFRVRLL